MDMHHQYVLCMRIARAISEVMEECPLGYLWDWNRQRMYVDCFAHNKHKPQTLKAHLISIIVYICRVTPKKYLL